MSYLTAAALCFAVLAGDCHRRAQRYKLYNSNSYQHAFGELVTAVSELDTALEKSLYATSPTMVSAVCTEMFGKAMTAQMSLSALPFSIQELENTSGFISRVGDYAFSLARSAAAGEGYTQEQLEALRSLSGTADMLAQNLQSLQTDLNDGVITMDELESSRRELAAVDGEVPSTLGAGMRLIEQEFPEIPSLIYDGPFSEHLKGLGVKMLDALPEVGEAEARRTAADFLGVGRGLVYSLGECEGDIPCYTLAAEIGSDTVTVAVSKKGGVVMNMLSGHTATAERVDTDTALETAAGFLEENGYEDMRETYHMIQDGILTANFAYEQDGVVCYSDLVKVSVALDNGKVCGFESKGYLTCHCARELPQVTFSAEDALAQVPEGLTVIGRGLAVIPSDGKREIFCHELKCEDPEGKHYIIYVNAESGIQEKILILLEDETGTLTI